MVQPRIDSLLSRYCVVFTLNLSRYCVVFTLRLYANELIFIDINECLDIHLHSCDQICSNIEGGYVCSCRQGFQRKASCEGIIPCVFLGCIYV